MKLGLRIPNIHILHFYANGSHQPWIVLNVTPTVDGSSMGNHGLADDGGVNKLSLIIRNSLHERYGAIGKKSAPKYRHKQEKSPKTASFIVSAILHIKQP